MENLEEKLPDDINRFKNILAFLFVVSNGGEMAHTFFNKKPLEIIKVYKENIGDFNLISTNQLVDYGNGLHLGLQRPFNMYLEHYRSNLELILKIDNLIENS